MGWAGAPAVASRSTIRPRSAQRHDLELRRHGHVDRCGWCRGVYGGGPRHVNSDADAAKLDHQCRTATVDLRRGGGQRGRTGQSRRDRRHDQSDHQRTTADVAGNNITITGSVSLNGNVTFTTDHAIHDGTVAISGTIKPMRPPIVGD